ncbi:hypothetical protein [Streptomyces cyaneofuscatus]|uniref:hypothetical protein n=1 Tax=Streptomyces cyaneofuscatus TaxID=66883 RepID=UPI00381C857D
MELHELLREWEEAAVATYVVAFDRAGIAPEQVEQMSRFINVQSGPFGRSFLKRHRAEIDRILNPDPRLSHRIGKRRRSAARRRTTRNLMRLYVPEYLDLLDAALESRSSWVEENGGNILSQVRRGEISGDLLLAGEALTTAEQIRAARVQLGALIVRLYPLGGGEHCGNTGRGLSVGQ